MGVKLNLISRLALWIRKKSVEQQLDGSKRKITLDELCKRSINRMKLKRLPPLCPMCFITDGVTYAMTFRTSHIVTGTPVRDDLAYKCMRCNHTVHFGLPMTREDAEIEIELRGGSYQILQPSFYKLKKDDAVKQRLRDLGYLDT